MNISNKNLDHNESFNSSITDNVGMTTANQSFLSTYSSNVNLTNENFDLRNRNKSMANPKSTQQTPMLKQALLNRYEKLSNLQKSKESSTNAIASQLNNRNFLNLQINPIVQREKDPPLQTTPTGQNNGSGIINQQQFEYQTPNLTPMNPGSGQKAFVNENVNGNLNVSGTTVNQVNTLPSYVNHSTPNQNNLNNDNASDLLKNTNQPTTSKSNLTNIFQEMNIPKDVDMTNPNDKEQNTEEEKEEEEAREEYNRIEDLKKNKRKEYKKRKNESSSSENTSTKAKSG